MIEINIDTKKDDIKNVLDELRIRKKELELKFKMNMPMTDKEYSDLEKIDMDIQSLEDYLDFLKDEELYDWSTY